MFTMIMELIVSCFKMVFGLGLMIARKEGNPGAYMHRQFVKLFAFIGTMSATYLFLKVLFTNIELVLPLMALTALAISIWNWNASLVKD